MVLDASPLGIGDLTPLRDGVRLWGRGTKLRRVRSELCACRRSGCLSPAKDEGLRPLRHTMGAFLFARFGHRSGVAASDLRRRTQRDDLRAQSNKSGQRLADDPVLMNPREALGVGQGGSDAESGVGSAERPLKRSSGERAWPRIATRSPFPNYRLLIGMSEKAFASSGLF